jgi:pimeloyl-ACP methyl ester carboxylesterase
VLRYDPGIAVPFRIAFPAQDVALWELYDAIRCPTLLVRGAESDLLTRDVAEAMTRRGPRARLVEIPGVGHAPALLDRAQIDEISAFLD